MFGQNLPLSEAQLRLVNLVDDTDHKAGCSKCQGDALGRAGYRIDEKIARLQSDYLALLPAIPMASIPSPFEWAYDVKGLVTAQSTTGTGMLSDLTSAFTDLFGTQSKAYNSKLRLGEDLCRTSLRMQAVHAGANAITGVDLDYAEVGGQRAMLMVCMTGTAVSLRNAATLFPGLADTFDRLQAIERRRNDMEAAKLAGRQLPPLR